MTVGPLAQAAAARLVEGQARPKQAGRAPDERTALDPPAGRAPGCAYPLVASAGADSPRTVVALPGAEPAFSCGAETFSLIAGPCAVESIEQTLAAARAVRRAGGHALRGGAFKPRTSPYSFRGLGGDGLRMLAEARAATGLAVVTEVLDARDVELVSRYADILQVGARNMQNQDLLEEAASAGRPVLLKRGFSATVEEWLLSAEYIANQGNLAIILCERGIRTFETHTRYTLDLSSVLAAHELSRLPVIVDPSHASGRAGMVAPLARAALAAGADGVMVEVHPDPPRARCDAEQALGFEQLQGLASELRRLAPLVGRRL